MKAGYMGEGEKERESFRIIFIERSC